MESIVALQWAYPVKRQAAYATVQADADLTQSHPFEGADFGEHTPNIVDNAALLGKGHEFATNLFLLSWDTRFRRTAFLTSKLAGWAMAFHCGKVTTTPDAGTPTAYSHVFEYQDHTGVGYYGSGRQLPVMTVVEKAKTGLIRQFPSMALAAVELSGNLNDFCRIGVDMIGSGKMTRLGSFVFPTGTAGDEGERLRNTALTFEAGPTGSLDDMSCDIRSWRFRSEYAMAEDDGYCPGSGYYVDGDPLSGQIRSKLEFLRRAVILEFTVRASADNTLFTQLEGLVELAATITLTGSDINAVPTPHSVSINIPKYKYRAVPIGSDGDLVIYNVSTAVMYADALANPFEVTVANLTPAYLVSS